MHRKDRAFIGFAVSSFMVLNLVPMRMAESKEKYQAPRYQVLSVLSKESELRRYTPRIIAQVEVSAEEKAALDERFRILAGYIFGRNNKRVGRSSTNSSAPTPEKIPLTAPVTCQPVEKPTVSEGTPRNGASSFKVRFFMPPAYTLGTLPEPQDKRVKLIELPEEEYAAIKFSGGWNRENFAEHEKPLRDILSQKNVISTGSPIYAYYNPPFTLPFLRHNEVLIPLSKNSAAELGFTPFGAI